MCAATSPSETIAPPRWSDGAAVIALAADDGVTRLRDLYQSDPCRVLFPRPGDGAAFEAVVVTTSGGIVGGDRIAIDIEARAGVTATVTTQAAEKIYRSAGPDSLISVDMRIGEHATLEWMPQGTILFDGARLRRTTAIDAAPGSRLLAGEFVVFGRRARAETFTRGLLHAAWRLREGGRLVWADALHLDGDVAGIVGRKTTFDDAAGVGAVVYRADDARRHLSPARDMLAALTGNGCDAAVTCMGALLVVRFLGREEAALRAAVAGFWSAFRAGALGLPARLPRVWET
jgi:urease accessory protein